MAHVLQHQRRHARLHFSWTCILAWLFVTELRGWYRYLGLAYPLLTLAAIVVTGNHYFLDAVVGVALIGVAILVIKLGRESRKGWQERRAIAQVKARRRSVTFPSGLNGERTHLLDRERLNPKPVPGFRLSPD